MEKLKELFSKAKIKFVISVDDCHRVNERPDDYTIKTNMAKNLEETAAFFVSIHREDFADIIQDSSPAEVFPFIDSCFQELEEDELRAYACSYMKDLQIESSAKAALSNLLEELKSSAVIEEFCAFTNREEAQKCFDNIYDRFDVGTDKRVLWMIDKDLSQSGGSSDSGVELINAFFGSIVVGWAFSLSGLIYEKDEVPFPLQVIFQMVIGMGVLFAVAIYLGWMPISLGIGPIITWVLIACIFAAVFWFGFYIYYTLQARDINKKLESSNKLL